ncbi:MAG: hypothetical protein LBT56_06240 [Prevotellaceae bacterium]|jgi:hypothetical protein|nr:hypothetical protein [Prevotellaceae bacterium]
MKTILKLVIISSVLLASCNSDETIVKEPEIGYSPYCNKVYEYVPAPGQFINNPQAGFQNITTENAAVEYAQNRLKNSEFVSLGGFGGYIVVGFNHSINNLSSFHGYDFSIKGNQYENNSEPAVVWVMQDVNKNGLPDDIWYELRGSEYGKIETVSDYEITYYKPQNVRENVRWTDNKGNNGYIEINEYNTQDYYYPIWITAENYTLKGVRLKSKGYSDNETGIYYTGNYDWGYADNYGQEMIPAEKNKNLFKINNAVKSDGTAANLQYIDFVKIQNALNTIGLNGIGESSPEILSVEDENI